MLNKIACTLTRFDMLKNTKTVTVALSGGADSVCLLHSLLSLSRDCGITVSAAHFNHKIRGEEAERDQAFCEKFCKELGVLLTVSSADVPLYAQKNGISLELAARKLRYEFFSRLKTDKIATAHTASDNLETVLFNLCRGSGSEGLCGIPPVRDRFIRPLISCSREETENYCAVNSLSFVTDSTNLTDDCTRNIIRHKIVPVLKEINPAVVGSVYKTSDILRQDNAFLNGVAKEYFKENFSDGVLNLTAFAGLDGAVSKRVLKQFCLEAFGATADSFHINKLFEICLNGGRLSMPENKTAVSDKKRLFIESESEKTEFSVNIIEKTNNFFKVGEKVNNLLLKNALDCDKIEGSLTVRTREAGDKMRLANKSGTKSFKKLYNEYKIPNGMRESLPVISDASGPVWVYKIGVADRVAVGPETEKIFSITVSQSIKGEK